ncbi:MAG: glycosyltransferase family 2 protein [Patescibacteria group bacterium]
MLLSIIIVSYNTADLTLQTINSCLNDIKKSKLLEGKAEIILIDNNSSDDSLEKVKRIKNKEKNIFVIANKKNTGFAVANNQGIKKAKGKYVLLLNSDTIVQKNALEELVNAFEKFKNNESTATLSSYHNKLDKLGILSSTLLNKDASIQPQGGSFPNLFSIFNHMMFLDDIPILGKFLPSTQHTGLRSNKIQTPNFKQYSVSNIQYLKTKPWVAATAMLIKREVFDEIGFLDENIFMYGEDIEFCMRAANHHWDVAIHPKAQTTHLGCASSSSKNALIGELKGYIYIWSKHKPLWQLPILKNILRSGIYLRIFLFATILQDKKRASIYREALTKLD